MLYFNNDINSISWETVRKFYKEELDLRYKRCRKPMPSVTLNYSALADLCCYIKEKLQEGYELFSLDETGFGSASLQKYCWIEKGKEVQPAFKK